MDDTLGEVSSFIWGPWLLIPLLLGTGIYLTVRLGGLQFRMMGPALRLALIQRKDEDSDGDISHYQALATALAATVGVGNIAGVASAIYLGGPGAIFWMWVTAIFGMASKYSEAFLGVRFRTTDEKGEVNGGPQQYLTRGIPGGFGLFLSIFFAIAAVVASFGIGNMTQSNTVAQSVEDSFGLSVVITGLVLAALTMLVLVGGIKAIARVTSAFVPLMIVLYVTAGITVLLINITAVPGALALIVTDAFTGTAATGGFLGSTFILALQYGVARGIFSNESGLGTAAIAAAAAKTNHPVRQGLVSMTQTFIDTIIVVTITALVIVSSGAWESGERASVMTAEGFQRGLPGEWGDLIVTITVIFFAFSTVLGWAYYGERNIERLIGLRAVTPYRVAFSLVVYVGATTQLSVVWLFSDIANGLMALPNLIGLLILSGLITRETKAYLKRDPDLRNPPAESTLHGTHTLTGSGRGRVA